MPRCAVPCHALLRTAVSLRVLECSCIIFHCVSFFRLRFSLWRRETAGVSVTSSARVEGVTPRTEGMVARCDSVFLFSHVTC
mmetsp:Transcript_15267/g.33694  ORF Transcript_15267/g.33694 Transcript_15267/m.33694 type:complete len:82 (+) Transcript_15267:624-869(+)